MHKNEVYYLGLTDKNNKEVASNSTIKFGGVKGNIFYSTKDCRFKVRWEDNSTRGLNESFIKATEIV